MKKLVLLTFSAFMLWGAVGVVSVRAEEDVKPDHYQGEDFKNKKEAMKALMKTSEKMAVIAADENLDVSKMEQIHEISYTTEDAVTFLNKKSKLDDLAEKLEEVHLASEDHKADELRRDFITYQTELARYLASE